MIHTTDTSFVMNLRIPPLAMANNRNKTRKTKRDSNIKHQQKEQKTTTTTTTMKGNIQKIQHQQTHTETNGKTQKRYIDIGVLPLIYNTPI